MQIQCNFRAVDHDHACEILEAFAEGLVLAAMAEIGSEDDDGRFPCCIKCGGFQIDPHRTVIDGPSELVERKRGCELALVVYQVAQRRREKDPNAWLCVEHVEENGVPIPGRYHFLLCHGEQDEQGNRIFEDPLEDLRVRNRARSCNCPDAEGTAA